MAASASAADAAGPSGRGDLESILPLELIRSQLVPPAPNRRRSAIDWLPDFGGFAWIAYGASSLLVISHCPCPLFPEESAVGPFLRQVIESPPGDEVIAVAWRHSPTPEGHLAAGSGKHVRIYEPSDATEFGLLKWRQVSSLTHSFLVEAIKWTGSGDGLVSVGCEVVVWKQYLGSWEVLCTVKTDTPQVHVSLTWSVWGPIATASSSSHLIKNNDDYSPSREVDRYVLVHHNDSKCGFLSMNLLHPCSVAMIQWRPFIPSSCDENLLHPNMDVLLTYCVDGVVRLWSEIDDGQTKKSSKDTSEQHNIRLSYHVIAVVEICHSLEFSLDADIFVAWGTDIHAAISVVGDEHCNSDGCCDWLIAVGPGPSLTFWAIHLLDDVSAQRSPRVNLWKQHHIKNLNMTSPCNFGSLCSHNQTILINSAISRKRSCSPPNMCSLLLFSHENTLCWLHLQNPERSKEESNSFASSIKEENLSCSHVMVLNQDGHEGNILQIAVHPSFPGVELAVSMDSHGILLFWSITSILPSAMCLEAIHSASWKLLGRLSLKNLPNGPKYLNLSWAPFILDGEMFLHIGHAKGIDCFAITLADVKVGNALCNKLFTISFSGMNIEHGPYQIFVMPPPSSMEQFVNNKYMLVGIWMKEFRVVSCELFFKLKVASDDFYCSNPEAMEHDLLSAYRFECSHAGKVFCITTDPFKLNFSSALEQVTSFALPPDNLFLSTQILMASKDLKRSPSFFHMATGFANGNVKVWRLKLSDLPTDQGSNCLTWEMVGMLHAHHDPVDIISLTNSGINIATSCMRDQRSTSELKIWALLPLVNRGCFSLEQIITFEAPLVALSWVEFGNGQALLGVCMQNELRIYSQTRGINLSATGVNHVATPLWSCIALCYTNSVAKYFFWGPKLTPVLVHENSFSLFSQWSLPKDMTTEEEFTNCLSGHLDVFGWGHDENSVNHIPSNLRYCNIKRSSKLAQSFNALNGANLHNILTVHRALFGSLPIYHPKTLISHLNSGKCHRAHMALQHLIDLIHSSKDSTWMKESSEEPKHFFTSTFSLSRYFEASADTIDTMLGWNQGILSNTSDHQFQRINNIVLEDSTTNFSMDFIPKQSLSSGAKETLESVPHLAFLNDTERNQLLAVIDLLGELDSQQFSLVYRSFDEPARRFWVATRLKCLYFFRNFAKLIPKNELIADSWMIAWAHHSDCQDYLFDSVIGPELTWSEMRNMGVGYWFTNVLQLRNRMEKLARSQYLLKKDAKDCALLYLALNRLQVLTGLFRLSKDDKDKPLVGFLSRNFQEEKNKVAALKNAYVLLGRHQHELAIAFFLLGQDPSSAVMVCAKNLCDEQLALVICRLVEGYGGPLERELIMNVLLPKAVDEGDYWLASLLEWTLGLYSQSFRRIAESCLGSETAVFGAFTNHAAKYDPSIGEFCAMLVNKTRVRNSMDEHMAAMLFKWSVSVAANALDRCGFPLEALECMSSWINYNEAKDRNIQKHSSDINNLGILCEILNPSSPEGVNWLSGEIIADLEYNYILNTAMKYVSGFPLDYPCSQYDRFASPLVLQRKLILFDDETYMNNLAAETSKAISFLHQMYSLRHFDTINMILMYSYTIGMVFLGYCVLHASFFKSAADDRNDRVDLVLKYKMLPRVLLKSMAEICSFLNGYMCYCSFSKPGCEKPISEHRRFYWTMFLNSFICSTRSLRIFIKLYGSTSEKDVFLRTSIVLDHIDFLLSFASAWCAKSLPMLILMIDPIRVNLKSKQSFHDVIGGNIADFLCRVLSSMDLDSLNSNFFSDYVQSYLHYESGPLVLEFIDEKWLFIGASLWRFLYDFHMQQFNLWTLDSFDDDISIEMVPISLAQSLTRSLAYTSSLLRKHLMSRLCWKVNQGFNISSIFPFKESGSMRNDGRHCSVAASIKNSDLRDEDPVSMLECLLEISFHAGILESSLNEKMECSSFGRQKKSPCWNDVTRSIECQVGKTLNDHASDNDTASSKSNDNSDLLLAGKLTDKGSVIDAKGRYTNPINKVSQFLSPKDVYRRSGELIEVLCSNYTNEYEAVLASNRTGLVFLNWDCKRGKQQQAENMWTYHDWPGDNWAEVDGTLVVPKVNTDGEKGTTPGSSGITGTSLLGRPGKDLTGGGAFGIPGYAGIGASGLGWSMEQGLDKLVDLPVTVDNIRTRVLSGHPSKPLFLVGSNSRVHLWEFGKEKAAATYGTPTISAHPSAVISALGFDRYGHRFASAAMDGVVSTWQLEVRGSDNVKPTESFLCFSDHACDVAYMGSSGSVIAAAGYSKSNANIVLWDTLAPPISSQALFFCHEGGATSLSVFNDGLGFGSASPIVVTGGRNGDVCLHDFRYFATGRLRWKKHSHEHVLRPSSLLDVSGGITKSCDNLNGMLWYIENAHLGNITKISTIPNTSLFLTCGKEGDVKLWDAKRTELIFHWPKLHEKHTFFGSSSGGIGGIVRVGVTDMQILSDGFLTCGGDGTVKYIQLKDILSGCAES